MNGSWDMTFRLFRLFVKKGLFSHFHEIPMFDIKILNEK